MKVRVKVQGRTQRLELPSSSPTLGDLHQALLGAAAGVEEPLSLSLNKRDPLVGTADTPLRELGVCSGDLLWLLSPAQLPPLVADPPSVHGTHGAAAERAPAADEPAKRARGEEAPPAQQQQQQQAPASESHPQDKGKQAASDPAQQDVERHQRDASGQGSPSPGDTPLPPMEPVPPSQHAPAYLLRCLAASPCAIARGPAGLLLLAAHAAMLETGFLPSWALNAGGGAAEDNGGSVYVVPETCWVSPGTCRVEYHLVPADGSTAEGQGPESMDSEPAEQLHVSQPPEQRQQAGGPACTLHYSSLGGGRVVLAVGTRAHRRHVALQAAAFVQPLGAAQGEAAGPSSSSTAAAGQGSESAPVALLPGGGLAIGGVLALQPVALRDLWRQLKDGLAFPMLLASYAEAGLQPPAGLLALPGELKQRAMALLGGQDLASLCCTCSELRHLGAAGELWAPLFGRDFPHAPAHFRDQALHRGFKWAYGQCWRERARREEELRRARSRAFMPGLPRFGVPRPPPFYPAPPGPGFPRIIGGDYDRLPQFGPGLGPPGHFLGGGAGPGGTFFSSRRRQGRGGPGGFRLA